MTDVKFTARPKERKNPGGGKKLEVGSIEETRIKTISNNFTRSDFGGAASRRRTRGEKERRKRERQRGGRIVNKKAIVLLSGIRPRGASEWRGGEQQPLSRKGPHRLSRKNGSRMTAPLFERWNGTCVRPSLTGKNGPRERASRALLPFPARVARETGHKGADLNGGYLVLRSLFFPCHFAYLCARLLPELFID